MRHGLYDLARVQKWWVQNIREGNLDSSNVDDESSKGYWDKESKKYQAGLRELELKKRRGELIEWSEVEDLFVARIGAVKAGLIAFERSMVPDLIMCRAERDMAIIIRKAVRTLLDGFARELPPAIMPKESQPDFRQLAEQMVEDSQA